MTRAHAQTQLHKVWHRRVEGQIRSAMNDHPGWFTAMPEHGIQSIAKRIVGEIVAAIREGGDDCGCSATPIVEHPHNDDVQVCSASSGAEGAEGCPASSHAPTLAGEQT